MENGDRHFYEQYAAYKQAAAGLEKDVSATEPRDLDELEAAVETLRKRYDEIQARLEVLNTEKAKLEELHAQHTELTKALAVKTAEAQNWVALAKTCAAAIRGSSNSTRGFFPPFYTK